MARNSIVAQQITHAGTTPLGTSPNAEGDIIDTGSAVFLLVSNTGAGSVTVTVQSQATFDGLDVSDLAVTVPAGGSKAIGPLATVTFGFPKGNANADRAFVDYTGTLTDIKRSLLHI
ncbi:hypothetical protein ACWEF6_01925 [Amycolatopsis sp. NPDC004772]